MNFVKKDMQNKRYRDLFSRNILIKIGKYLVILTGCLFTMFIPNVVSAMIATFESSVSFYHFIALMVSLVGIFAVLNLHSKKSLSGVIVMIIINVILIWTTAKYLGIIQYELDLYNSAMNPSNASTANLIMIGLTLCYTVGLIITTLGFIDVNRKWMEEHYEVTSSNEETVISSDQE